MQRSLYQPSLSMTYVTSDNIVSLPSPDNRQAFNVNSKYIHYGAKDKSC
ncbi:MAG: hypothetical protein WAQ93_06690 [Chitinophagaceae bacterium]